MKEILFNRMYAGKFATEGHEVINLFKADDGKNYVYINHTGRLGSGHDEIENILLVQGVTTKTLEIIAKAKVVQSVWNMPDEERLKKQGQVTYGGVALKEIFNEDSDYPYISFEVEKVIYPKEKTYITIDKDFNKSNGYIVWLPNENNAIQKLAGQSLHSFFPEIGNKSEAYNILYDLINDESKWEKENRTEMIDNFLSSAFKEHSQVKDNSNYEIMLKRFIKRIFQAA